MLTPQAIKDQEFQTKFRGYDSIEVRAYLELLAEDFFDISEKNRSLSEEIEALRAQRDFDDVAGLREKLAAVEEQCDILREEKVRLAEEAEKLQEQLSPEQRETDRAEIERLRARVAVLETQNEELKSQGLDFKSTILAAQNFADNLKESSQAEAAQLMENAKREVESFRAEFEVEMAYLPEEIERLRAKKNEVREELRAVLNRYLQALEEAAEDEDDVDDLPDLFESIQLPDSEKDT